MLKEIKQDIWELAKPKTVICILTNRSITRNGENVMGAGIALEVCKRNGDKIKEKVAESIERDFNILLTIDKSGALLYRFDTKYNVYDVDSDLGLIKKNLKQLNKIALQYIDYIFYLPRPGCGVGGLDWETEVKPLCDKYLKAENIITVYK